MSRDKESWYDWFLFMMGLPISLIGGIYGYVRFDYLSYRDPSEISSTGRLLLAMGRTSERVTDGYGAECILIYFILQGLLCFYFGYKKLRKKVNDDDYDKIMLFFMRFRKNILKKNK
ncbi:hypothetical protein ABWH96_10220 [Marivirga tractuosa]|uniref:hypothetical protein n=1 Tax=Marivirga tractuosa TaxID=1006 RepID=UPI0035D03380